MRITCVYFCITLSAASALMASSSNGQGLDQKITFGMDNEPLTELIHKIEQTTPFTFAMRQGLLGDYPNIQFPAEMRTVREALDIGLANTSLTYELIGKVILIVKANDPPKRSQTAAVPSKIVPLTGIVRDDKGDPLAGVSVMVKGSTLGTTTDATGKFQLDVPESSEALIMSFIGFKPIEITISGRTEFSIVMEPDATTLEEVQIQGGYYSTTAKTKTGSISRITTQEISNQPVTNPLMALQGRIPGVEVTPTSGVPGSSLSIRIRGVNSLRMRSNSTVDGNLPLYIIDGIQVDPTPLESGSTSILSNGYDPLSFINPENIESIEVLKDADATSIYGSRGANGVIIITTKGKGKNQGASVNANLYSGVGMIPSRIEMLNREQYLEMRHESIRNDGEQAQEWFNDPDAGPIFYPDLLVWDTTRYTDWQEKMLGEYSKINDAQLTIAAGNTQTTFLFGGAFHEETTLYPGDFGFKRYTGNINVNHKSIDERFKTTISVNYGQTSNDLFNSAQFSSSAISLPPVAPSLYNEDGTLNWGLDNSGSSTWSNPASWLLNSQSADLRNLNASTGINYELADDLILSANLGYSTTDLNETIQTPIASLDPTITWDKFGSVKSTTNRRKSLIFEPQASWSKELNNNRFSALLGFTFQKMSASNSAITGTGYTSDAIIGSLDAADVLRSRSKTSEYRYVALFSRLGYSFANKYIVNITGRRDGSSRFGTGNRFGYFGSIGAAWVFSNESFFSNNIGFISYGKIRGSYGTTGNDQIGDSQYIRTYGLTSGQYNGATAIIPTSLYNPDYAWELTKKLELAVEVGFGENETIMAELAWFRNRSSNQLVQYTLPAMTGFTSVLSNFPALVENSGMELSLTTKNIRHNNFRWTTSANISFPRNRLVRFDGIEQSPYSTQFEVGKSLFIRRGYVSEGVDQVTGLYSFADLDDDGVVTTLDQQFITPLDTKYYGGLNNSFAFYGLEISFLFQFASRYAITGYSAYPGSGNHPVSVLNRWRQEGDVTSVQKYSDTFEAVEAHSNWLQSSGSTELVNYIRLKTVTIAYSFAPQLITKAKLKAAKLFIQGQNVFTSTGFKGWDPETLYNLPPLKVISVGLNVKL